MTVNAWLQYLHSSLEPKRESGVQYWPWEMLLVTWGANAATKGDPIDFAIMPRLVVRK